MTESEILETKEQVWISEDVEMENEFSYIKWGDAISAMRQFSKESVLKCLNELYEQVKHGDDEHRAWLRKKFDEYLSTI